MSECHFIFEIGDPAQTLDDNVRPDTIHEIGE